MINLLPDTAKQDLKAAHTNIFLLKIIFVLGLGVAFLCFISIGVYFILMDTKATAENVINLNQQKTASYSSVQEQAFTLKASLSNAKTILDNEVRYTKLLTTIASLMPEGTIIDSLNLNDTLFGTPTNLTVYAKSTEAALKLKDSFQSSPLFTNVSFETIAGSTGQSGDYPVTATLSLTINRGMAK